MKKIELSPEQILEIISIYQNNPIGMSEIGKKYGVSREVIKRILKENNIKLTSPGQKYKGGKKESDKRYRKKRIESGVSDIKYDQWIKAHQEYIKNYRKEYYQKNKEKLREKKRINQTKLILNNPQYKLAQRFRTAIWQNIKDNGQTKYNNTFNLLPYTFDELKQHLENLFTDGMRWDNYGEWHVDHAIPQSKFSYTSIDSDEFRQCWSLGNLKPMWGKINTSKNNDLTYLTLDAVRYLQNNHVNNIIKFNNIIISKEYLKSIINSYGKDYLEEYIDDILNLIWKASPELPKIDTNENVSDLKKYSELINPLDDNGNIVNTKINSYGNMFLKSRFSSYWKSSYAKRKSPTECWKDYKMMRLILKYRLGLNNSGEIFDISLKQMIKGISATRTSISFFKPLLAFFLYKKYLGDIQNPIVFDPCCGFGGRLLGFKCAYPNGTYIGCEPNIETYKELIDLTRELNLSNVKIYNSKFEDMDINFNYDLALTSVPYFNLEKYSNVVEYNNYNDWLNKFMHPICKLPKLILNLPINIMQDLFLDNYLDCYLINNKTHFKKIINKEAILKLNF